MEMKKAYTNDGVDWIEVVIPPQDEGESEYTIRAHLNFLISNWHCLFGQGCPGLFPKQSSTYAEDTGCCTHSFYFDGPDDMERVKARVEQLTDEDWDSELRDYVKENGFIEHISDGEWVPDPDNEEDEILDGWQAKGKVYDGACVFANRNGGSSGKIGCAFHHMGERNGEEHVDVMPTVCWQLPLRYTELRLDLYELGPWDVSKWIPDDYTFTDVSYMCSWWCVDTPEAYSGKEPVYKMMRRELIEMMGEREYNIVVEAIEKRLDLGNIYPHMPGAVVNDGRPLLPLLIGNRTPRREPSNYPALLAKMKEANDERVG